MSRNEIFYIDPDDLPIVDSDWESKEAKKFRDLLRTNRKQNIIKILVVPRLNEIDKVECEKRGIKIFN